MGCLLIPLLFPAILAVSFSISLLTSKNSWNLRPCMWWNSAHSSCPWALAGVWGTWISSVSGLSVRSLGMLMSCRIKGLRVTIPLPLGRKSRPTMFSKTDDLPDDCDPTTTWNGLYLLVLKLRKVRWMKNLRFAASPRNHFQLCWTRDLVACWQCSRDPPLALPW